MEKIQGIPREKIVSDLLEYGHKPTEDGYVVHLHEWLCREFGMDIVDSPFSNQLLATCNNFLIEFSQKKIIEAIFIDFHFFE